MEKEKEEFLPLKHIKKPEGLTKGTCSEIFKFKPEQGKNYVYKEIRMPSRMTKAYPGVTFEEKAASMKKVHGVLKEFYGDKIADTHYIIAKNKNGDRCIMAVQEEIQGPRLDKLGLLDPRYDRAWQQREEIREKTFSGLEKKLKSKLKGDFDAWQLQRLWHEIEPEIKFDGNFIADKKGNLKIIDW